jgi:aldehyde:ferredoxin oxidoreductase
MGLGFAVSPTGADHQHSLEDLNFVLDTGPMKELGILETLANTDLTPDKVRLAIYYVDRWFYTTASVSACSFPIASLKW